MPDTLRIRRRVTGLAGAPSSLANAELAYNEVDHVLYYGEGTGGSGGTASVIAAIAGQGLAYTVAPQMNGTAAAGTQSQWSRGDHVHPSDTSRYAASNPAGYQTAAQVTVSLGPYAPLFSPALTGVPTGPTATGGTNTTQLATTAFVTTALGLYAPLASPSFTGVPVGPTAAVGTNTTQLATTAFVMTAVPLAASVAPVMDGVATVGVLSTWARGDHVHPSDTSRYAVTNPAGYQTAAQVTASLAPYAPLASPTFTGTPAAPTATAGTSTTQLATTAFVTGALTLYAKIDSQIFTGTPQMPVGATGATQANGVNNTTLATTAFVRATRLDQFAAPTAPVSFNSQQVTNVLAPVNNTDAANKLYVDQNSAGLSAKGAVAIATAGANITLSGLQTIDGYTVVAGDRVLVKDQTLTQNNGIYVAAAAAWSRAADMSTWAMVPQAYVFVSGGTVNSASSWVCNSGIGGTLGTTPITWVQFSQQAQVTAGGGLTRTGNSFDVGNTPGRIAVFADNIDIDSAYVGQPSITTLGAVAVGTWNATTITAAHGGTGATTLTGYVKGNGVGVMTASATVPTTDITGLGTMAAQNASAVAITGGTIDGIVFDMGTF